MTDEELLAYVKAERANSIGFEHDEELTAAREQALNYYKGKMPDIKSLPNRSKAVSTDIADAIDTLLPDIMEILAGGDDVVAFIPLGEEDEEQAQQETDYIRHVVFNENPGWQIHFDMAKDAFQSKIGVAKFWAEECKPEEEKLTAQTAQAMQLAAQNGEIVDVSVTPGPTTEELYDFTVKRPAYKKIKIASLAPEDFTVGSDTVRLSEATYCAHRTRPRAQDLIREGYDEAKVNTLSAYGREDDDTVALARDTAGEHEMSHAGTIGQLRRVEIVEHVIRLGGKLWSVVTGENESVFLRKEEIDIVPFAAVTPYPVTHRFYGESVADRLIQPQQVNTAITRGALDSIYFGLNRRMTVNEKGMTANTIPDLLRNEPGVPIRTGGDNVVAPVGDSGEGAPYLNYLEYFQTKIEQRTGITRAAQGLTPDTLHETAKGALALLSAAQKRVRLIARTFAETGLKDLYLGVHALVRQHVTKASRVRLRNGWVDIDPTSWGARSDMSIEIGLGASGKEADLMVLAQEAAIQEKIVAAQGGVNGPVVTWENVFNLGKRTYERLGNKAPEKYLTDPADPKNQKPPEAPPEDPKVIEAKTKAMEAQAKTQLAQQEAAAKAELAQQQALGEYQLKVQSAQADQALKLRQAELAAETQRQLDALEIQAKERQAAAELALKERVLAAELGLKQRANAAQNQIQREDNAAHVDATRENNFQRNQVSTDIGDVDIGGAPG